jgi:hypothetical protein
VLIQPFFSCTTLFSHVVSFLARLYRGQEEEAKEKKKIKSCRMLHSIPRMKTTSKGEREELSCSKRTEKLLEKSWVGRARVSWLSSSSTSFLLLLFCAAQAKKCPSVRKIQLINHAGVGMNAFL